MVRLASPHKWLISVPCWGADYVARFLSGPALSIAHSIKASGVSGRMIVHTDLPDALAAYDPGMPVILCPRPAATERYAAFGDAHRDALSHALDGEIFSPLTADATVSDRFFAALQSRIDEGFDVVAGFGPSTSGPCPPPGMSGEHLMKWAVERIHPRHKPHIWPAWTGVPAAFCFISPGHFVARVAHQHPAAIRVDHRARAWTEGTCDDALLRQYDAGDIYSLLHADEACFIESSADDRPGYESAPWTPKSIADDLARRNFSETHMRLFERRMVLIGDGSDRLDCDIMNEVFRHAGRL